jgi:GNAT superfamily N-acetyltransferase
VSEEFDIISLAAPLSDRDLDELSEVLADCVEGGASVNFMSPYSSSEARRFFDKVANGVASGELVLLAARLEGRIVGTVQLGLDMPPNQLHRADVKKMLVHRSVRGRGLGAALMVAIEEEARQRGRWLLVLDTVPGESGHRLYLRSGWLQSGTIPDFALFPDGRFCDTAIMWKWLDRD